MTPTGPVGVGEAGEQLDEDLGHGVRGRRLRGVDPHALLGEVALLEVDRRALDAAAAEVDAERDARRASHSCAHHSRCRRRGATAGYVRSLVNEVYKSYGLVNLISTGGHDDGSDASDVRDREQHRPARARPTQWRDRKRYLWLIGLVVPVAGVHRLSAMWRADRLGRVVLDRPDRDPGDRPGDRPGRRPRPLQPARRRDRGARAGPLLPVDHLPLPADPVRRLRRRDVSRRRGTPAARRRPRHDRSASRSRSAASAASASTPPTSSATRRRPTSAGCPRSRWRRASTATSTSSTTAATTSASPRPRTPPPPGWARASTSSGRARSAARCSRRGTWRSGGIARRKQHPWRLSNDVLNAWLMSAVLWGAMLAVARHRHRAVPRDPGGRRLLAARGRQLHGALRDAAAEGRRR